MGRPNFAQCAESYTNNATLIALYRWTGPVYGVARNETSQITVPGCIKLCGDGTETYPWPQIANTITTWVLPAIGILIQAPFESNKNKTTFRSLARWMGSPIASMTSVLWNINVSGRCCMLVDMATSYGDDAALDDANFVDMRDSFYLLAAMNQFVMDKDLRHREGQRWTDGLLRFALFSRDLTLQKSAGSTKDRGLRDLRREIAYYLRTHRKRGVVPVIISDMWFIVALAISIQAAFGDIGKNAAAHDLAIGLLVAWLPLLMLSTIVDRNFSSTRTVQDKLNELIHETAVALAQCHLPTDPVTHNSDQPTDYLQSLREEANGLHDEITSQGLSSKLWESQIYDLINQCRSYVQSVEKGFTFFQEFAGQGRTRRHHGIANTIVETIESEFVSRKGRNWLRSNEQLARWYLVIGRSRHGLLWFDKRELVQVLGALIVVCTSIMGAFILSFCVPTVGLGCRSGSYLIFMVVAIFLQIMELSTWGIVVLWRRAKYSEERYSEQTGVLRYVLAAMRQLRWKLNVKERQHLRLILNRADIIFFGVFEALNASALILIITLQTVGGYETCYCQASTWTKMGGYIDFTLYNVADVEITRLGWVIGTTISCAILGLTMIWIVIQWIIQSHLSTEDYHDAKIGLKRTRRFHRYLYIYIWPFVQFPILGVAWTWKNGKLPKGSPSGSFPSPQSQTSQLYETVSHDLDTLPSAYRSPKSMVSATRPPRDPSHRKPSAGSVDSNRFLAPVRAGINDTHRNGRRDSSVSSMRAGSDGGESYMLSGVHSHSNQSQYRSSIEQVSDDDENVLLQKSGSG